MLKILHEVSSCLREYVPHLWDTTLVRVPEEATFRRSGNLRETLLLLVPKQLDGNIKKKGQLFENHLDLVLGNLLYCLDQMTARGLFQPQSLLFCDAHMQMDYIPWHARPGKNLQTLSRPVDLVRAYRNEHLILSQQFSKHPAGKAHRELTRETSTQCRGIKWATTDSSHLHFCDSTACNKSVMPQLWLLVFWRVGVAGDIELVSFVGKEQAYTQCGHKKSSPCPRLCGILCFKGSSFTSGYRIDPTSLSSPQLFPFSPSSAMLPHTLFIAKVPLPVPLHNNCIRSAAQLER